VTTSGKSFICRAFKSRVDVTRELDNHINYYKKKGPLPDSLINRHHLGKYTELVTSHASIKLTDDELV
jgi:hypothetical protein